jgi:hypothetical protein
MTRHELALYWLTLGLQIVLCALVYVRNLQRRLPFFAAYVTWLVTKTSALLFVYHYYGFRSPGAYYAYWFTTGVDLIARSLAIAELCRYELRAYRGIWALTWRALAVLALLLLGHAAVDAWGQPDRLVIYGLTLERDLGISSIVILLAVLIVSNYYGLSLDPVQEWLATGMFFFCAVEVVNNSMLRETFTTHLFPWFFSRYMDSWSAMRPAVERANAWWNDIRSYAFMVSMAIWCVGLRKPLSAPARKPLLLPSEVYGELSPAINLRLRAFNDRLQEILKP